MKLDTAAVKIFKSKQTSIISCNFMYIILIIFFLLVRLFILKANIHYKVLCSLLFKMYI